MTEILSEELHSHRAGSMKTNLIAISIIGQVCNMSQCWESLITLIKLYVANEQALCSSLHPIF